MQIRREDDKEMRVIPDWTGLVVATSKEPKLTYYESDTVEITDEEWQIIWRDFKWTEYQDHRFPFAQYLHDLIELARAK